ncbi:MAG: hypothetical protein UW87_C0012G0022, partial [Candidatus Moranbacteria bacterium GW2011_GWC2_45_10]
MAQVRFAARTNDFRPENSKRIIRTLLDMLRIYRREI